MRILYVQYTNPAGYPPLQHSSRMLADAGCEVLFLGTGALGADALAFPPHPDIHVRNMGFCKAGWRQKLHYFRFFLWVLWTVLVWRPRWIYASDQLACPIVLPLTFLPGLEVVYHEHDSPPPSPSGRGFEAVIARARNVLARRADICVLPNRARLERFIDENGPLRSSACVWNCPATAEAACPPRAADSSVPLWLLYHGSIVPDRLPPAVIGALALLPDFVRLRIAGYETGGSRGYVAQLRNQARTLHIEHRLEVLGTIPQRAALLTHTRQSSIGLSLMPISSSDRNCENMTGASNKAFDYMACGLVLLVSDRPDWRQMFADPGYGFACDPESAESIAAAIRELIADPARLRQMGERGRQRILAEWNYETVFRPVFQRMSGSQYADLPARPRHETSARQLP